MFTSKNKTASTPTGHATIRDGALILSLEAAEVPLVARFDLDSLAQANFIVQSFDKFHQLSLRDFSGQIQPIAQFSNKMDAHHALHHILQALVTQSETSSPQKKRISFRSILAWILMLLGVGFLLTVVYAFFLYKGQLPVPSQLPQAVQLPDISVPEGEPQDVDHLYPSPQERR